MAYYPPIHPTAPGAYAFQGTQCAAASWGEHNSQSTCGTSYNQAGVAACNHNSNSLSSSAATLAVIEELERLHGTGSSCCSDDIGRAIQKLKQYPQTFEIDWPRARQLGIDRQQLLQTLSAMFMISKHWEDQQQSRTHRPRPSSGLSFGGLLGGITAGTRALTTREEADLGPAPSYITTGIIPPQFQPLVSPPPPYSYATPQYSPSAGDWASQVMAQAYTAVGHSYANEQLVILNTQYA